MATRTDLTDRFLGRGNGEPLFLPDLTLWYDWHRRRGTLPTGWEALSLPHIARAMGLPVWVTARPWRDQTPGLEVTVRQDGAERSVITETRAGALAARWTLGPDGDWWQIEYPVKTPGELPAAVEWAAARVYTLYPDDWIRLDAEVGDDGIVALELPRRPFSDLLHDLLGWSQGLMLLGEPAVQEILDLLEEKLQQLVTEVASLPGSVVLSPDNLDGQYISPRAFRRHLSGSYSQTARALHGAGKRLVVHAGGPVRHLLAPLAEAGIDGVEGIAGPPQGNSTLAEARLVAGPELTLWGGIPQDALYGTHAMEEFQDAVHQAAQEAKGDPCSLLGVADRVPVQAEIGRLEAIPALVRRV